MKKRVEVGDRYGKLVVIKIKNYYDHLNPKQLNRLCKCRCDCGNTVERDGGYLRSGKATNCGCESRAAKHRLSKTLAYRSWRNMHQRIYDPTNKRYNIYGGRGIKICDRWHEFEAFFKDMGERPEGLSLDRIDTNGNYEPENCRYTDAKVQAVNRRPTRFLTHQGETLCIEDWGTKLGIDGRVIGRRLKRGDSIERALRPVLKRIK